MNVLRTLKFATFSTKQTHNNVSLLRIKLTFIQRCFKTSSFTKTFHSSFYVYDLFSWAASSKYGTYRLCEQRRFRRVCASEQSRQNLRCSLIQAVSQEQPSDRKPDPWPFWIAGHAQLKFVMTECSKTQIRLTGLNCLSWWDSSYNATTHNSLCRLENWYGPS